VVSYTTGGLAFNSTCQLVPTTGVYATYSYIDLVGAGKEACARLTQQNYQNAGIASESVGSLSRSYVVGGMDEYTKRLLAPYKRPHFA
jgi:hypothetical protein